MIYESLILSIALIVVAALGYRLLSERQAYKALSDAQRQADFCKSLRMSQVAKE